MMLMALVTQGVDYQEVFSSIVCYSSIWSLLAVANIFDWKVHQMDVKTAFLQGELDKEMYMKQPDGYVDKKWPNHVYKLKESISGLKQGARCRNTALDTYLKSNGYHNSSPDQCLYIKSAKKKSSKIDFVILALYVDDIMWFLNNIDMLNEEKTLLARRFKVKDLDEMLYILGMSVKRKQ